MTIQQTELIFAPMGIFIQIKYKESEAYYYFNGQNISKYRKVLIQDKKGFTAYQRAFKVVQMIEDNKIKFEE